MADVIARYNPNAKWGGQMVEIVLKQWDYQLVKTILVGGNCHGLSVMDCAVNNLYEECCDGVADDGLPSITLARADGDTLLCEDEEDCGEDWLKNMVVSLRIVDYKPPTLNEMRAMNGAKPLPPEEGDQPWEPC